jgi:NAD+ synthase (glutamine-hydrolysing)
MLVVMFPDYTRDQIRAWVEKFTRLFLGSIYKWVQAPISLHIGNLDLDRERALQLPVVQNQKWAAIAKPELEITSQRRLDGA